MVETQTFITFAVYNIRDATSTTFLQQILSDRLLLVVIVGAKK